MNAPIARPALVLAALASVALGGPALGEAQKTLDAIRARRPR